MSSCILIHNLWKKCQYYLKEIHRICQNIIMEIQRKCQNVPMEIQGNVKIFSRKFSRYLERELKKNERTWDQNLCDAKNINRFICTYIFLKLLKIQCRMLISTSEGVIGLKKMFTTESAFFS